MVDVLQLLPDPLIRRQLNGVVVLDPELVLLLKNIFYFSGCLVKGLLYFRRRRGIVVSSLENGYIFKLFGK